jgi:hypothetical protein
VGMGKGEVAEEKKKLSFVHVLGCPNTYYWTSQIYSNGLKQKYIEQPRGNCIDNTSKSIRQHLLLYAWYY